MEENNLNVTSLATKLNLPVPTVWRYINNKFKPNTENALLIQEKLGIPIRDLFPKKLKLLKEGATAK